MFKEFYYQPQSRYIYLLALLQFLALIRTENHFAEGEFLKKRIHKCSKQLLNDFAYKKQIFEKIK